MSMNPTPMELAYLAGVLDSDGSITIVRQHPNRLYPDSYTYSEHVQVGQCSREAVDLFHLYWPGEFRVRDKKPGHWRPLFVWRTSNIRAAACIKALRPYLRIKSRQADLALALRASKERGFSQTRTERVASYGGRARRLSPEVQGHRTNLWNEIRMLNDVRNRRQGYTLF
jgi:hypothetical protein